MKTILDYADLVKEQHALNTTIAPVETDLTSASQDYAVGQKFVYDGVLYQAKAPIAQGAALVLNTNYEAADDVSSEIEALTNKLNNEVTTRAGLGAHNLFGVGNSLDEWFAATNDGKLPTSYLASETITGTVDKDTNSIVITNYNNTGYRWGCKKINLKKNTSYTFSRTSCDGTIQLFGKNNADDRAVVISGLSNGGTVNSGDYDWWYVGFYPTRSGGYFSITDLLVKLETDADTTFQPYAKTNQELTAENQTLTNNVSDIVNVLSAKNLWSETIPPTANSGGSYTLANHEYVVSTTASANSGIYWSTDKLLPYYADKVGVSAKLSFEVKADAAMRAYVGFYNNEVNLTTNYQTIEQDIADLSQIASAFKVYNLDTTSAHTISMKNVMIRPASITSDTFVPYAMTNRELTEKINEEFSQNTASISAQINYKDVYLFTTNGGASSGSAQYSSAYLVFGQATTQITYFPLKEGTEITPSVNGTTFTLTSSTSITMAYRKL